MPDASFPEKNPLNTLTKISSLFHSLLAGLSEKEQEVIERLAKLEEEERQLLSRYQAAKKFSDRLWEVASVCEILFNLSDEKKLCELVVNFLARLHPGTKVKFLYANNSRTKMKLVAAAGLKDGEQESCVVYPLDCLALKRCKALVRVSPEADVFCPELGETGSRDGYLCVPLMANGCAYGCINMVFTQPDSSAPLDENDLKIIDVFTTYVSLILNNNLLIKTVQKEALTDRLTGLPNRRYALEALQSEIFRSERYGNVFSLAVLDVDLFKTVNDNYGHDEGDRVLTLIAETANKCLRRVDTVARFGGEEFLVILPQTGLQAAVTVIERFRKTFNQQTFSDFLEAKNVTLSAGLAEFPTDSKDALTLIKIADERMLKAKREGRNQVVWK
jgi:diguanylate cyclase (GGDEF)-like protein